MTKFQKKENDATAAFQKEMDKYGLHVDKGMSSGHFTDNECSAYCTTMATIKYPVKGNKELIEELVADGYSVVQHSEKDRKGNRRFVFRVQKSATIKCEPDDGEDYVEPGYEPEYFRPDVGTTYENRGGGRYQCIEVWNSGLTFSPTWDARMINTATGWSMICHGMLIYPDGTIEWDYSSSGRFEEGVR